MYDSDDCYDDDGLNVYEVNELSGWLEHALEHLEIKDETDEVLSALTNMSRIIGRTYNRRRL